MACHTPGSLKAPVPAEAERGGVLWRGDSCVSASHPRMDIGARHMFDYNKSYGFDHFKGVFLCCIWVSGGIVLSP